MGSIFKGQFFKATYESTADIMARHVYCFGKAHEQTAIIPSF